MEWKLLGEKRIIARYNSKYIAFIYLTKMSWFRTSRHYHHSALAWKCLKSLVISNVLLDREIYKRVAKAADHLAKLSKRVWDNNQLTLNTKLKV